MRPLSCLEAKADLNRFIEWKAKGLADYAQRPNANQRLLAAPLVGPASSVSSRDVVTLGTPAQAAYNDQWRQNGCRDTASITVTALPLPTPNLAANNPWLCPQVENVFTYTVNGQSGSTFSWQAVGAITIEPSADTRTATIRWRQQVPEYRISVRETNVNGCSNEATLTLQVDESLTQASPCDINDYPLSIPNVITPNGDGFNEALVITNLRYYPQLTITNRWGQQVYQSTSYRQDWTAEGLPAGVYFYQLTAGKTQRGWVQVVR